MAYPTFPQLVGSKEHLDEGTEVERSVSGKPRFRTFYTQTRRAFTVVHDLNTSQLATLMAQYNSEKGIAFTFDWQGTSPSTQYTVRYAGAPDPTPVDGDGQFKVTCELVVV